MTRPHESGVSAREPFETLAEWVASAERDAAIPHAHAACLATSEAGGVDARMVLVHEMSPEGFVFLTDSRTEKARAARLAAPGVLVFYWGPLDRQVRVRGHLTEATDRVADRCFSERPRGSRITAWISRQSTEIKDPTELEQRYLAHEQSLTPTAEIGRPAHYRAYALVPEEIELWEARRHRLHQRRRFRRSGAAWTMEHLEP